MCYGRGCPIIPTVNQNPSVVQAKAIPGATKYLAAAYWSLTTVATIGFGDILPNTDAERAVMLMVEIIGVVFFGEHPPAFITYIRFAPAFAVHASALGLLVLQVLAI